VGLGRVGGCCLCVWEFVRTIVFWLVWIVVRILCMCGDWLVLRLVMKVDWLFSVLWFLRLLVVKILF